MTSRRLKWDRPQPRLVTSTGSSGQAYSIGGVHVQLWHLAITSNGNSRLVDCGPIDRMKRRAQREEDDAVSLAARPAGGVQNYQTRGNES